MPQNVMVADTKGNIYYQRTGRTPIRPDGYDFSAPVDGTTSESAWKGIHPTKDLIQILNPPQGYMQNCNITPDVMMVDSPMTPDKYPAYIFNQPALYTHQRATRATELLHTTTKMTEQQAIDIALDKKCYQYDRWVAVLAKAHREVKTARNEDYWTGYRKIRDWDGYSTRDSNGALVYYYWRNALAGKLGQNGVRSLIRKVNNYLDLFGYSSPDTEALTEDDKKALVEALQVGMNTMRAHHGSLDAVFGDVFRVGRLDYDGDDVSWPVGGGSLRDEGMATVRAIGFTEPNDAHERWGRSGQTSTEVVILSTPIRSYTQPPIGQSDHSDSPHFRDQARELLSKSKMKPAWFNQDELMDGHVKSTRTLEYAPAP